MVLVRPTWRGELPEILKYSPPREEGARNAAGVVAHTATVLVSDHPVCGAKVGFAEILLMPQPPLLTRRGILSRLADILKDGSALHDKPDMSRS